ncbi:MAG: peptide deformylase [Gammaproteobacteria bacterium]|nr:peptide deformylase [Gammaproteobacteria bacterium]MCP4880578.1 peptide deformylase [Gammaproteobacteria bacterium]
MALLPILEFPDPRLRKVAEPVTEVTDSIRQLTDDMLETMYAAPGIGLAATQVDVHQRIVVIDVSEEGDEPLVLINPEWEALDEDMQVYQEGCLSVPEFYDDIDRHSHIVYRALDRDGQAIESQASDLLAICIQHELDHLNGKLFVDYLSRLKRDRIRKKLEKKHRLEQQGR